MLQRGVTSCVGTPGQPQATDLVVRYKGYWWVLKTDATVTSGVPHQVWTAWRLHPLAGDKDALLATLMSNAHPPRWPGL